MEAVTLTRSSFAPHRRAKPCFGSPYQDTMKHQSRLEKARCVAKTAEEYTFTLYMKRNSGDVVQGGDPFNALYVDAHTVGVT